MDYDLQVYDFGQLEETDLGGLLDEGLDEFNDDTFGALEETGPVGRDFDFAGNTNKFLGGGRDLKAADSSWLTPAPAPAPSAPSPPAPSSAWNSLDADPLLGRGPPRSAVPPAKPMKTLEEIEAEMRAQAQARQQPPPLQQPQHQQQQGQGPGRPLTLEEVEAEMLRRARSQPQQPSAPSPAPGGQQQPGNQQFSHQQPPAPFFGASPQLQPAYPPQSRSPFPPQFGGMPPQMGRPFPGPPGMPFPPQHGRPGSMGAFPPGMLPPPPHGAPSPHNAGPRPNMPPPQLLPFPGAPGGPGVGPGAGPDVSEPGNMMHTLFPPLPSQATPVSLEQQLQYLTMNQHAQHPSLTGAQLQALLQQAQMQKAKIAQVGEKEDAKEEDEARKRAGEMLIMNVERRIREHEDMEKKRKIKANKIASMAKHNNLMSNSDKDFITRIQVSQLVTDDPYADDFYFHIMAAIKMSRQGPPPGARPPPGAQPNARQNNRNRNIRRENAMSRMAQNVQRLVDSAKQRNKSGQLSVDGALGKIALRTRSAPRQLLQVTPATSSSPAPPSAGHSLLSGLNASTSGSGAVLTYRAVLAIVEEIYDIVLDLEQMKRGQPAVMGRAAAAREHMKTVEDGELMEEQPMVKAALEAEKEWEDRYAELSAKLWTALRVMEPLDQATIHPFISLVSVLKGKRILGRAIRHLSPEQTLTLLTLLVATFDTLDTVVDAPLLDATDDLNKLSAGSLESKQKRAEVETKTETFLNAIIGPFMTVVATAPLRMVTGMLGLLMERNNITKIVHAKPGIAFLTILLNRAESLKQAEPAPEAADLSLWEQTFNKLFNSIAGDLPSLFPSTRAVSALPFGPGYYLSGQSASSLNAVRPDIDLDDEPVWRFLASVAVCSSPEQQQHLVMAVREKVLENVSAAKKSRVTPEVAALKIRNADLLLHSLGLDSSQLTVDE